MHINFNILEEEHRYIHAFETLLFYHHQQRSANITVSPFSVQENCARRRIDEQWRIQLDKNSGSLLAYVCVVNCLLSR